MTKRKDETHEEYLARMREYNAARYRDPATGEQLRAWYREWHKNHKEKISARRHTQEYRTKVNVRLRERYAADPPFRAKKLQLGRDAQVKYAETIHHRYLENKAADPAEWLAADRVRGKQYRLRLREQAIAHYGGSRCACCGETLTGFLAIDHIDGGGNQHRLAIMGNGHTGGAHFYQWLRQNNWPDGFRVLCHNCNFAIGHYGACPHSGPVQLKPVGRSGIQGREVRAQVLAAYGSRCVCCGETTPEFLSIDHLISHPPQGDHLRAGEHLYRWLRREGWPSGFQLLCHNCNFAKGQYGECPHQR